jgi:cellulose synthase/poly-beta-1,6-N-acetylglucosamine synthase-like glycosyltransferase
MRRVPTDSNTTSPAGTAACDLAVVILAKDEANFLSETLRRVLHQLRPADQVHVVADGCRDDTAGVARRAGARVFERPARGPQGKGAALAWWLRQTHAGAPADQVVIVLDADSLLLPDCIDRLRSAMENGSAAAQAQIVPGLSSDSPIALLAALSEIAEQLVGDTWRTWLGWPVRLRGTGMAIRRSLLELLAPRLVTTIEDAELSLLVAARGLQTRWVGQAMVLDPKPDNARYAAQQRARWLKGQLQLVAAQPAALARTLALGPAGWSLVASVLLKPKAFMLPVGALACAMAWGASATSIGYAVPALVLLAWLLLNAVSLVVAVAWSDAPLRAVRALLLSPLYLVMWLRSAVLAARSTNSWPRARPLDAPTRPAGEPGHVG